ncbi:hypothetical protein B296_00015590 [Ensete ventricosum]|uniref:Uncharacterized protein n=1 Tax=Ensete ventricosum TaxID=4639 RepID=A0A427AMG5_ENSVE|nr:hypothetical protein B296_00015590 [Ensete ventricosum]
MVDIATVHLERDAIQWYNWFEHTQRVLTWSCDHRCKKERLLLIEPIDEFEQGEEDLEHENENMEEDLQPVDCIVHALIGYTNPQMMKIGGFLKQQPVTILINIRSINNFMDSKVVANRCSKLKIIVGSM